MTTEFLVSGRLRDDTPERMERAVEKVRMRAKRAAAVLEEAGIAYAVAGGNAVRNWVVQADEAAIRNTADVDILVRRADLPAVIAAMTAAGFQYRHANHIDFFTEPDEPRFRHGVHLLFAGEKIKDEDLFPAAEVTETAEGPEYRVLSLDALVRMKLTSFRAKDQTHLDDLLRVGLIDESWLNRVAPELRARLQQVIDAFEPDPDNLLKDAE
jgi:hypothetical protein